MASHGIGLASIEGLDHFREEDDDEEQDPDYLSPLDGQRTVYKRYNLRSLCKTRSSHFHLKSMLTGFFVLDQNVDDQRSCVCICDFAGVDANSIM
jgi:hypothetical protein